MVAGRLLGASLKKPLMPTYTPVNGGVQLVAQAGNQGQQVGSVAGKPILAGNTPAAVAAAPGTKAANGMGGGFYGNANQGANTVQPDPSTVGTSGTKNADGTYTVNQGPDAGTTYKNGHQAVPQSIEQQEEAFIQSLLGGAGKPDTSAQDAMIQQQEAMKEGKDVVNQRASMGRSGFGASGAMGAMEGDVRRADNAQATQDQLTYDTQQKQQSIGNAQSAMQLDQQMKQAAADQALQQEIMQMIGAENKTPAPAAPATGGPPPPNTPDEKNAQRQGQGADTQMQPSQAQRQAKKPPAGAKQVGSDPKGNTYWQSADGTITMCPPGATGG